MPITVILITFLRFLKKQVCLFKKKSLSHVGWERLSFLLSANTIQTHPVRTE